MGQTLLYFKCINDTAEVKVLTECLLVENSLTIIYLYIDFESLLKHVDPEEVHDVTAA